VVLTTIVLGFLLLFDKFAFLTLLMLLATLGFILYYFGFVKIDATKDSFDITYYTSPPAPEGTESQSTAAGPAQTFALVLPVESEVFYISDNVFTYAEAPAVCKAYDAELASYSQIEQAYNAGAEWCGYGWSQGGLALFPTQQSTWNLLQQEQDPKKRVECGRPGINGGFFDPHTRFGVNCYGKKPKEPAGGGKKKKGDPNFDKLIDDIKGRIDTLGVLPFNETEWSEYSRPAIQPSIQVDPKLQSSVNTIKKGVTTTATGVIDTVVSVVEDAGTSIINIVKGITQ
jgi:hypothetical protein